MATMPRIDHVAVETDDPDAIAGFYERILGGPGEHTGVRVSEEEQDQIKRRLDEAGIAWEERDHELAVGVFFEDPDGRRLEAIRYTGVE